MLRSCESNLMVAAPSGDEWSR